MHLKIEEVLGMVDKLETRLLQGCGGQKAQS
jgi:hypothetical protein